MIPTVSSLTSFNVYRDGGSLSASFFDGDGLEHTLFFPIHRVVRSDREFECLGYKPPVLQSHYRDDYTSPITGETLKSWDTKEQPVTWDDANRILDEICPLVPSFRTDYPHVFVTMVEIARTESERPSPRGEGSRSA